MSITKLPGEFRKKADYLESPAYKHCADKLEAALPVWTKMVAGDPSTWPKNGQTVMCAKWADSWRYAGWHFCSSNDVPNWAVKPIEGIDYWRPLCDLDFPPEQENGQ